MTDASESRTPLKPSPVFDPAELGLFDCANQVAIMLDAQGVVRFANNTAHRLLDPRGTGLVGRHWFSGFLPEDVVSEARSVFERTVRTGLVGDKGYWENAVRSLDGVLYWIGWTNIVGRSASGEALVLCIGVDLTRLRRAENRLAESEELFRSAFRDSVVGMCLLDTRGRLLAANQAFCDLVGCTLAELTDLGFLDLTHPDDRAASRALFEGMRQGSLRTGLLEKRCLRRDGSVIWVQLSASAVRGQTGETLSVVTLVEDVTERKRLAEDLVRAKEAAEAADRSKSAFLACMSHEIRTPLNGLLGMLNLLEDTGLDVEQREYLRMARESGANMLQLMADILDLSKIEAGRLEIATRPFSPALATRNVAALFDLEARTRSLTIELDLDAGIPEVVLGDEGRFKQILFNLIGNALKFTERGGVRVRVSELPARRPGKASLLFCVADDGIGVPDDLLEHIFKPFTQVDDSLRRKRQGAGLGLGIVKRLIGLLGGSLAFHSEYGRGTEVYFRLEFRLPEATQTPPKAYCAETSPEDYGAGAAKRLLIAEDDRVNAVALKRMLEKQGYESLVARNGREALEFLARERFDALLLDIQMPEMDGLEVLHILRKGEASAVLQSTPIVVLTAFAMDGDEERFTTAGANGYLAKPIDYEVSFAMLEGLFTA